MKPLETVCISPQRKQRTMHGVNVALSLVLPPVFKCENENKQPTLASDSPWSHERNLGNNANHLPCDVDPAEGNKEQQQRLTEGKHLAKEPQRCTHTRPRAGARPAAPYITMMKHSDQTRANPSFINVTAVVVVEKGPLSPLLPGRWMQHVATLSYMSLCHSINPVLGEEGKHSSSEPTRPRKHLSSQ